MANVKIIVVAYQRPVRLRIMIDCFLVQTNPNWEMYVIHDGPAPDDIRRVMEDRVDPRIHFFESPERRGKYGHPNRREMLETIPTAVNDYILITNDDNYYIPRFVDFVLSAKNAGIVYYDCLHNYYDYDVLKCRLRVNYIDMGALCVRADVAKKVGFTSDEYHADGIYAEACAAFCGKHGLNIHYIPKPIFTHN